MALQQCLSVGRTGALRNLNTHSLQTHHYLLSTSLPLRNISCVASNTHHHKNIIGNAKYSKTFPDYRYNGSINSHAINTHHGKNITGNAKCSRILTDYRSTRNMHSFPTSSVKRQLLRKLTDYRWNKNISTVPTSLIHHHMNVVGSAKWQCARKTSSNRCGRNQSIVPTNTIPRNIVGSVNLEFSRTLTTYSRLNKQEDFSNITVQYDDQSSDDEDNEYITKSPEGGGAKVSEIDEIFTDKREMSNEEWQETIKLMSEVDPYVTPRSCDAVTIKKCLRVQNYSLATSYMEHIQRERREPNLSMLGNYLQLCGEKVEECGLERFMEYYHKLTDQAKLLDFRLTRNIILGLAETREWRRALDYLPHLEKVSMPGICRTSYSAIVRAAFREGDYDLGWKYYALLRQHGQRPDDSVYVEWVRACNAAEGKAERKAMALTLLKKLENDEMFPSVVTMDALAKLFRDTLGWSALYVKIPKSGVCPACRHQLVTKPPSEEDFKRLQEEFVPRVLLRSDIFRTTSPEEWSDFKEYVEERKPFTAVVDGLNASYIVQKRKDMSRQKSLSEVLQQVMAEQPSGRILVLGRQHMAKWSNSLVRNRNFGRVEVYTLNNMSKDDGFFLYAALQSGLGATFVTSDLLRDHYFRLGEVFLQDVFLRWQRTHQVMAYASGGCVRLMPPAKFSTVGQEWQDGGGFASWHLPYDDTSPRQSHEVPATWLCLNPSLPRKPYHSRYISHDPLVYSGLNKHHGPNSNPRPTNYGYVPLKGTGDKDEDKHNTAGSGRGRDHKFQKLISKMSFDTSPPPSPRPPKIQNVRPWPEKGVKSTNIDFSSIFTEGNKR